MAKLLDNINSIKDIKKLSLEESDLLSKEIRDFLIDNVSKTGGHLASNLGVVELTLSLYKVFDFNKDKLIWDVGHQAYVHKILTGRKEEFKTLRQFGGLSGFPKRCESVYDHFETGHSSTSISAALGIAKARDLKKEKNEVVAVIGDGALTGGMALEALNHAGFSKTKVIIILNDNQMSIAKNVGAVSTYLNNLRVAPKYNKIKEEVETVIRKIPNIGDGVANSIEKVKNGIKQLVVPGMMFEDIGIKYFGPIDGHNIKELTKVMASAKSIKGPVVIHVITKKGKGYGFAEERPDKFHGVGPFHCESGEVCSSNLMTYSKAFGDALIKLAKEDRDIVAITAAMRDGTGLKEYSEKFPDRFVDVGIAEQHAVTLAAGMASQGLKPVFAVYSTFLQRAYDQILHDVCIQKLPVILAVDRAGIVGDDGETHQGVFDLSYLSHMPNMTIIAPKCIKEMEIILKWAFLKKLPIAIRYPRGGDSEDVSLTPIETIEYGKWETIFSEGDLAILATGKMVATAIKVREKLLKQNIKTRVINCCFIKPIDKECINNLIENNVKIVTVEDNVISGGLGSNVLQYVNSVNNNIKVLNLGFKDEFIPHGKPEILYKLYELDIDGIMEKILKIL